MHKRTGEHPFGDAGQLISLGAFLVVWVGDSFFLRVSTSLSGYVPLYVRLAFCCLMVVTAGCLFRSGHVVVHHENGSHGVMSTGAFRYVRHPLYLASILTYLGLTLATASFLALILLVGIFIFHNFIAGYEEKLLEARFGEEYTAYKRRTGKWVPRIQGRERHARSC